MKVSDVRRFFDSLPSSFDELPVVIAPSGYPMPAEANRCTYIPDEAGGIVSLGPVLLVEPT